MFGAAATAESVWLRWRQYGGSRVALTFPPTRKLLRSATDPEQRCALRSVCVRWAVDPFDSKLHHVTLRSRKGIDFLRNQKNAQVVNPLEWRNPSPFQGGRAGALVWIFINNIIWWNSCFSCVFHGDLCHFRRCSARVICWVGKFMVDSSRLSVLMDFRNFRRNSFDSNEGGMGSFCWESNCRWFELTTIGPNRPTPSRNGNNKRTK